MISRNPLTADKAAVRSTAPITVSAMYNPDNDQAIVALRENIGYLCADTRAANRHAQAMSRTCATIERQLQRLLVRSSWLVVRTDSDLPEHDPRQLARSAAHLRGGCTRLAHRTAMLSNRWGGLLQREGELSSRMNRMPLRKKHLGSDMAQLQQRTRRFGRQTREINARITHLQVLLNALDRDLALRAERPPPPRDAM